MRHVTVTYEHVYSLKAEINTENNVLKHAIVMDKLRPVRYFSYAFWCVA